MLTHTSASSRADMAAHITCVHVLFRITMRDQEEAEKNASTVLDPMLEQLAKVGMLPPAGKRPCSGLLSPPLLPRLTNDTPCHLCLSCQLVISDVVCRYTHT